MLEAQILREIREELHLCRDKNHQPEKYKYWRHTCVLLEHISDLERQLADKDYEFKQYTKRVEQVMRLLMEEDDEY